jgi:hypothetical protein
MPSYAAHLALLESIKDALSADLMQKHHLRCEVGDWMDCAVLKLQKPGWTPGTVGQGIFFAVWLGEKELQARRFNYNIHALKMRELPGHAIKPREFAAAFREAFAKSQSQWPNVSTDYGPQTLMQGWMPLDEGTFRRDVEDLVGHFVSMYVLIDELLLERSRGA